MFLLANMLPQEALVYPLYYVAKQVGLYDTRLAVIIIFTVIQSAFGTYLLASVLGTFPRELLEAAALDGAGKWQVLWRVVFPDQPAHARGAAHLLLHLDLERVPHPAGHADRQRQRRPCRSRSASLQGDRLMDATTTNAGALLSLVPAILFFLIFQRTLTRGITAGAEK